MVKLPGMFMKMKPQLGDSTWYICTSVRMNKPQLIELLEVAGGELHISNKRYGSTISYDLW